MFVHMQAFARLLKQKLANDSWESCELGHEMMYEHGRFLEPEEKGKASIVITPYYCALAASGKTTVEGFIKRVIVMRRGNIEA